MNTQKKVQVDTQMAFYTWVGLHLMWNEEFDTMNDFLCIGAMIRGIWAQSPQLVAILQIY